MNSLTIEDTLPEGTFNSGLSENQIRALKLVKKIGKKLISEHPEIAEAYLQDDDLQTYLKVAKDYISDAEQFPQVASRAVGYAIRRLVPKETLSNLTKVRNGKRLENFFDGFDSEKFREHCRNASKKRHESGIGVDTDAMIKARGMTPWSEDEKAYALKLSKNAEYQHTSGSQKGKPDYDLIALELNITYHDCKEVRYQNSVASFVRDSRRKGKKD